MFDFNKIEDKSLHNPVVPILINNNITSDMNISTLNLEIIRELCKKKKLENIDSILEKMNYNSVNKLKKKDKIKKENSLLKFNLFYNNVLENKYIITSIYDYILETCMIISGVIEKPRSYCLKLGFSYEYLYKKYDFKLFKLFYKKLYKFIKKTNQIDIMNKFPELYHSKNLMPLLEETLEPFEHQKKFIHLIKNKNKKVIINASPIGSGKTILQTTTIMHNKSQDKKKIILITCPNKVVLETVAQACNNENTIAYWFMYDNRLVPSYFCNPRRKKSKYPNSVQKCSDKNLYSQYKYYVEQYYKILNDPMYIKNFYLPDVIFAVPEQALLLLQNEEMNKMINKIVIDEFLIPSFDNFEDLLDYSQNCSDIILLSASAPNSKELFVEKYPNIINKLEDFEIEYIYESIVPSFIYCKTLDNKNWLPTNELTAETYNEKIKTFNWYHYRFYPPQIIYEMKKKVFKLESDIPKISYKSVNELIKESEEFLLSICDESYEIKTEICNFKMDLQTSKKKDKTWMIITNNPIDHLQKIGLELNIEDILTEFLEKKDSIDKNRIDLQKQLESLEKCTIKKGEDSMEHIYKKRELEDKLSILENEINVNIENGINSIKYEKCIEIKKFLLENYDRNIVNNIMIELFNGNIVYDIKGPYYKYISCASYLLKNIYVSPIMAYGTDMNIYGVKVFDDIDSVTLVQAFGRAGRTRKDIYVPVIAPLESLKRLID